MMRTAGKMRLATAVLAVGVLAAGAVVGTQAEAGSSEVTVTIPLAGGSATTPGYAIDPNTRVASQTVTVSAHAQTAAAVSAAARRAGTAAAQVSIGSPTAAPPVASGFVGLSVEYPSMLAYASVGPLFDQLVQNLAPDQRPVLRVGGDSTDHTYWPATGIGSPGLSYALTPAWIEAVRATTQTLDARLTLGLNFEADRPRLAAIEAHALSAGFGGALSAFELGNEPNLYAAFPWYTRDGHSVYGRAAGWSVVRYLTQVANFLRALPRTALWGPSVGNPSFMADLPALLPNFSTVTYHAYPTNCYSSPTSPQAPTVANLLAPSSSTKLAAELAPWAAYANRHGRSFRIDEINTTACAGRIGTRNIVAALWALEAGFSFAEAGISGVNVHTFTTGAYRLFSLSGRGTSARATVMPEYYGWMMFARAAPPGSRLLHVAVSGNPHVRAFADRLAGTTHVVLINDASRRAGTVVLSLPGTHLVTIERLLAPSLLARRGLSFAGLAVPAGSATGQLAGRARVSALSGSGRFSVSMPAASAAMLTVTP